MRTLVIDTATDQGLVAIGQHSKVLGSTSWRSSARHGENIIGRIEQVLEETRTSRRELRLIGVCIGPGGFTRVRVGLATAKGLALALQVPIVGVSALRTLARQAIGPEPALLAPVIGAYRGEVYGAGYRWRDGKLSEVVAPSHGTPDLLLGRIERTVTEGEALVRIEQHGPNHGSALVEEVFVEFENHGASDLATLEPAYLRPSDAKQPAPR